MNSLRRHRLNAKLLRACEMRDLNEAQIAIEEGADINCRKSDYMTPLHIAADHSDVKLVCLLCSNPKLNVKAKTMQGFTAVHIASLQSNQEIIYELLKNGANLNARDNLRRCPIHYAALQADVKFAKFLIKSGSYIHVYDVFQETPVHISAFKTKNRNMIKLLLGYKLRGSPYKRDDAQKLISEAILGARFKDDVEIAKMIISYSPDINIPDPIGRRTPLHLAALTGHSEIAKYLIDNGADLHAENCVQQTPIQVALICKNFDIVRLIEEKMESNENNRAGMSKY